MLTLGFDFISNVELSMDGDGRDPDPVDPGTVFYLLSHHSISNNFY
jgi:hypothetical protein